MKYGRTFNFSAGPAMMPEPVLEEIRDEMMNRRFAFWPILLSTTVPMDWPLLRTDANSAP